MGQIVISASRTKDLVRNAPEILADILDGKRECLLSRGSKRVKISMRNIHTLVLWTKTPFNIMQNKPLNETLTKYVREYKGLIYLHVTVTGFGGTFVEYGIPYYKEVKESLQEIIKSRLIHKHMITVRYDPFGEIEIMPKIILSNMQIELFEEIIDEFAKLGIKSIITSRMDLKTYPYVAYNIKSLGLKIDYPSNGDAETFVAEMDESCRIRNIDFTVCCNPRCRCAYNFSIPCSETRLHHIMNRRGCIDSRIFNEMKMKRFPKNYELADLRLHNAVTKGQREGCRCTYSKDIGYSEGLKRCYSYGIGCIYCYAQQRLNKELFSKIAQQVSRFKQEVSKGLTQDNYYNKLIVNRFYDERRYGDRDDSIF